MNDCVSSKNCVGSFYSILARGYFFCWRVRTSQKRDSSDKLCPRSVVEGTKLQRSFYGGIGLQSMPVPIVSRSLALCRLQLVFQLERPQIQVALIEPRTSPTVQAEGGFVWGRQTTSICSLFLWLGHYNQGKDKRKLWLLHFTAFDTMSLDSVTLMST